MNKLKGALIVGGMAAAIAGFGTYSYYHCVKRFETASESITRIRSSRDELLQSLREELLRCSNSSCQIDAACRIREINDSADSKERKVITDAFNLWDPRVLSGVEIITAGVALEEGSMAALLFLGDIKRASLGMHPVFYFE